MKPHGDLTVDGVRAAVARLMDLAPTSIRDDDNLLELGIDSIKLMSLTSQWQRHGAEVSFGELAEHATVADWSRLLVAAVQSEAPDLAALPGI